MERIVVVLVFTAVSTIPGLAQNPSAASYPVDATAAAGMTSGVPNTSTSRQAQLVNARTEALAAQGNAVAASMARSADNQLEQQNRDRLLQNAREEKAIKREMAERARWERATSNNVKKVSASDMSTWQTNGGGVRVERNVPDPFITSLIEEEKMLARQEADAGQREPGFGPFKSLNPFKKNQPAETHVPGLVEALMAADPIPSDQEVPTHDPNEEVGGGGPLGFIGKIRPPKFQLGRDAPEPAAMDASAAEPQFVRTSSTASSAPAPTTRPGTIPRISGAELVDGRSPVRTEAQAAAPAPAPQPQQDVSFAGGGGLPGEPEEKPGLFSRLKSGGSDSGGGGLFSFGKKKQAEPAPGIDASLFPTDSVAMQPTGGSLGGGYTSSDVEADMASEPSSTGSFALPGEADSSEPSGGGFSFPKPSLSIPSLGSNSGGGGGGSNVPANTTVNSSGNSYYVVTQTAQFMVQGGEQMQSEIRALPAGTVVLMTKPGDNWAQISVPGGASGIVQNKFLRAASASEAGGQFAVSN